MVAQEMTLTELEAHVAELKSALEAKSKSRTAEVIAEIKAMAKEVGLAVTIEGIPTDEHPTRGAKLPPKFRCPNTGKTWTGRGVKPVWMNGRDKEQFRI